MLRLAGPRRELDDRRGTVEYLAAPVQDEVVMGGDEGKGDGEGGAEFVLDDNAILPPVHTALFFCFAKIYRWLHYRPIGPEILIQLIVMKKSSCE